MGEIRRRDGTRLIEDYKDWKWILAEGCCPDRHGPMKRIGHIVCECGKCGIIWTSNRIPSIFPKNEEAL